MKSKCLKIKFENRLHKVYGLSTLCTELKGNIRPNGVTDQQIDNLINSF
jgi:hypothetical protein